MIINTIMLAFYHFLSIHNYHFLPLFIIIGDRFIKYPLTYLTDLNSMLVLK